LKFLIYCLFLHTHVVWRSFYSNRRNTRVSMIKKILMFSSLACSSGAVQKIHGIFVFFHRPPPIHMWKVSVQVFYARLHLFICERWASKCRFQVSELVWKHRYAYELCYDFSTYMLWSNKKNHIFAENEV
jgi:hypothetical protein